MSVVPLFPAVTSTLEFLLMLVAMTFNVGLFVCVIAGLALGTLLFGHILAAEPSAGDEGASGHIISDVGYWLACTLYGLSLEVDMHFDCVHALATP